MIDSKRYHFVEMGKTFAFAGRMTKLLPLMVFVAELISGGILCR